MAIEVRQLIVKSTLQRTEGETGPETAGQDLEQFREQILDECREMILDQLRLQRER